MDRKAVVDYPLADNQLQQAFCKQTWFAMNSAEISASPNVAPETVADVWQWLCRFLRQMDEEAVTQYEEGGRMWTAGLRQYHRHFQPLRGSKVRCEVAWAKRLIELFSGQGISVDEAPYPAYAVPTAKKRQWTDLRIRLSHDEYFWLEVKGSWPVCFDADADGQVTPYVFGRYRSFLLDDTRADFGKLSALKPPEAHHIGILLIGFDNPLRTLDADVLTLEQNVPPGWHRLGPSVWSEPYYGTRVQCWLWHRSPTSAAVSSVGQGG